MFYLCCFISLFVFRYTRFVINIVSYWTFRPIPLPSSPSYSSSDITIIIPSLDGDNEELRETVRTCLRTKPYEIILVTVDSNYYRANKMVQLMPSKRIKILSVPQANKRRQMCCAIPEVRTSIIVFADDDVIWPRNIVPWILAPFEDPQMGGVGTSQRLRRRAHRNVWDILGASYLERRNFDISACTNIDGGLPCLSGRTVAYRTSIFQDPFFICAFTNETWRTFQLNVDDDNFITRWMVTHDWKTYVQNHRECEVQTSLQSNWKYIKQCLRWSRSNWRSNIQSMFVERKIWTRHPWSAYAVFLTTLTSWSIPTDALLYFLLHKSIQESSEKLTWIMMAAMAFWIFLVKFLKHLRHFLRYPADVIFLPAIVIFGYAHCFIKLYAMTTLHVTAWGSREGADSHDSWRMIPLPSYQETAASALSSLQPSSLTAKVTTLDKSPNDWNFELKIISIFPEAGMRFDRLLQGDLRLLHNQYKNQSFGTLKTIYDVRTDVY